jgi:hypothetical protein
MIKTKYCYQLNNDSISTDFNTFEEALAAAIAGITVDKLVFFIGKCDIEEYEPKISADDIFELIDEDLKDAKRHTYLQNISSKQKNELTKKLTDCFNRWAKKYDQSLSWYTIYDVEPYLYKDGKVSKIKIPKQ